MLAEGCEVGGELALSACGHESVREVVGEVLFEHVLAYGVQFGLALGP